MSINSDDMFFQPWKADWLCHIRRRNEAVREKNVTVFKINGSCKGITFDGRNVDPYAAKLASLEQKSR